MPINISTSNYINAQTSSTNQTVGSGLSVSQEGVVVSAKGLDLQSGQTISGQVIEIDGKDIKLLLSNNQTINARLEGNINTLLGQTLSFEVKNTESGQTALRPLYTNLNASQTVTNALSSASLPVTENYTKMVSAMMDEGMPINRNAISDMSKQINNFPNANPETIVKLNKLGLQINELTINQYENYKGLEHQIKNSVDTLSKGLTELMKDSLFDTVKEAGIEDIGAEKVANLAGELSENAEAKVGGKNLLTAFLNAISGNENANAEASQADVAAVNSSDEVESNVPDKQPIDKSVFDVSKMVLDMVNPDDSADNLISNEMKSFAEEFVKALNDNNLLNEQSSELPEHEQAQNAISGRANLLNELTKETLAAEKNILSEASELLAKDIPVNDYTGKQLLSLAKGVLNDLNNPKLNITEDVKEKLTKLLNSKEFGNLLKDNLTKQMLLKPEEVVNSKNVDDLYSRIIKQTDQALEILQASGKDNPEIMNAAKSISDNVNFMNELNQVATYVQLPLLMNNKAAHGDLYVYTNKKSLKDNDGNISALLHLDMDNLGPMDIYVQLTNKTKLNTHFYLKDEETIDFIEAHIDYLNKRLTEKGYDMNLNVSVKDTSKGKTNMADEFLKKDPLEEGVRASKFSFDVRA